MELHITTAMQSGWLGIDRGDWLTAIMNALAIVIAIIIASKTAPKAEERRARRDQQERLLRVLISTSQLPAHPEYQGAISLIPIDFKGNRRILDARTKYLELVNSKPPADQSTEHFNQTISKQSDLIEAIAQELGFDLTSEALRKGAYISKGFVDREELNIEAMRAWPKIADALELNNRMFAHSLGLMPEGQPAVAPEAKDDVPGEDHGR